MDSAGGVAAGGNVGGLILLCPLDAHLGRGSEWAIFGSHGRGVVAWIGLVAPETWPG